MSDVRFRRSVDIDAEASIDEFDDDVIVAEAVDIIRRHRTECLRPPDSEPARERREALDDQIQRLVDVLGEKGWEWEAPSTAATITSMAQLRAWVREQLEKFSQ